MSAPAKQAASTEQVDTATMCQNVSLALGPENQAAALPPAPEKLEPSSSCCATTWCS